MPTICQFIHRLTLTSQILLRLTVHLNNMNDADSESELKHLQAHFTGMIVDPLKYMMETSQLWIEY